MIRVYQSHLHVAVLTHPGMTGKQNEDRYGVSAYHLGPHDPTPAVFAVVSDGIGGHRAGEVAAEMAVEIISQTVAESGGRQPLQTLKQAVQAASEKIAGQARLDDQRRGMGTTCACAWVIADRLYTASVGDSRIYLLRGRSLRQVSVDHTWVQEAMERGLLEADQARTHPNLHVIRRYLGSAQPPRPDLRLRMEARESDSRAESNQGMRLQTGDAVLLCTDGLTDLVRDAEIEQILLAHELQEAAQMLVDLACRRGGHDNITVVLLSVPPEVGLQRLAREVHFWVLGALAGALVSMIALCMLVCGLLRPFVLRRGGPTPPPCGTPALVEPGGGKSGGKNP
jgi:protein phosphatase